MALSVIRDPVSGVSFTAVPGQRAYLLTEDGSASFTFRFAPPVIEYGTWEQDWVQVSRVGLLPLLVRKADKLDTMRFTINIGDPLDYFADQSGYINTLKLVTKSRLRVMMRYSDQEAGLWRVTACAVSSVLRHPDTNLIIRATADVTMTRASETAMATGPVSSPVAPAPVAAPQSNAPATSYTTAPGDTLWGIAQKLYGRGDRWPVIYDANRDKIASPQTMAVGIQLVIPP
jgi:LysM repeat protein